MGLGKTIQAIAFLYGLWKEVLKYSYVRCSELCKNLLL